MIHWHWIYLFTSKMQLWYIFQSLRWSFVSSFIGKRCFHHCCTISEWMFKVRQFKILWKIKIDFLLFTFKFLHSKSNLTKLILFQTGILVPFIFIELKHLHTIASSVSYITNLVNYVFCCISKQICIYWKLYTIF